MVSIQPTIQRPFPAEPGLVSLPSIFFHHLLSALTLLVGWQEGHLASKKLSVEVLARVST